MYEDIREISWIDGFCENDGKIMASSQFFMFFDHLLIMIRGYIYIYFLLKLVFVQDFILFIRFFESCVFVFILAILVIYLHFGQLFSNDNMFGFDVVVWIIFFLDFRFDGDTR